MTQPLRRVVILVVFALVAGCVGQGEATQLAPISSAATEIAAGTATVDVLVTDDSLIPLTGASVSVEGVSSAVLTDEGGRASIIGLAPGEYNVFVAKLGYESGAKRVSAAPDAVTQVQFRLAALAVEETYFLTLIFKGHMTCGGGLVVVAFTFCGNYTQPTPAGNVTLPALDPNHRVWFDQEGTPLHKTIIGEMEWQQTSGVSATAMQLYLWQNHRCAPVCDPEYEYGGAEGPSPVVLRSDAPFKGLKETNATLTHTVWTPFSSDAAPFVILTIQQPFTLFSTHFFGAEAPDDFSARPDA